ncbi:MAG: coniferyl aldehyde dehydrogenase [Limnobacter sp.]|nr:coniferyl aldehyde dehydrogenase [Limnobacter sp.]
MLQRTSDEQLKSGRLYDLFQTQKQAFAANPFPDEAQRYQWLDSLEKIVLDNEQAFIDSLSQDFGHRSAHESLMLDIVSSLGAIRHTRKHLGQWMKVRKVGTPMALQPASSYIKPQPLGVVGIITPWNFPVYLSLAAVAAALAAGNRVMLKPSELSPHTSALMARLLEDTFGSDLVGVVEGDVSVATAFSALAFDKLMFTGSTAVGRKVAKAAAENLTPCILELGGKSPLILAPSGDIKQAATCAAHGKMINAGQICVSPDYALVPEAMLDEFVDAVQKSLAQQYPRIADNADVTCVISKRHRARLQQLLEDAKTKGATLIELNPAKESFEPDSPKLPMHLVLHTKPEMQVMQEEIFGSILPVLTYKTLDEAMAYVNAGERPLALYLFALEGDEKQAVLNGTVSGGVTVNDAMWHVLNDNMPFGGVGASGMGAYHGQTGFDSMSHLKSVLEQSKINAVPMLRAPYGTAFESIVKVLKKIV